MLANATRSAMVIGCLLLGWATPAVAEPGLKVLAATENADPSSDVGPASYSGIAAIIDRAAKHAGIPTEFAEAVVHTESGFNQNAIGGDGEIGLMQVLPSTARMMGFTGTLAELAVPETNIRYGVTYLAQAYRLAGNDICTAVMKYRAGHNETRFSHLSVDYCLKVRARLQARGFAVTGTVPVATFGNPVGRGGGCRGTCLAGSGGSTDLDAFNRRIEEIVFQVNVTEVPRL